MDLKELELKVKELETRINNTEDIEQIKRLQRIYRYYLDNRLHQEIVDLFSNDTGFKPAAVSSYCNIYLSMSRNELCPI